jgi:hypothetical protein
MRTRFYTSPNEDRMYKLYTNEFKNSYLTNRFTAFVARQNSLLKVILSSLACEQWQKGKKTINNSNEQRSKKNVLNSYKL